MNDMEGKLREHIKKVGDYRTDMVAFEEERIIDIDCVEDTRPVMVNAEQMETDTDNEMLKCILITVEGKRKVAENLTMKIDRYKMKMPDFMKKIEELDKEIREKDNQLNEQIKKIEDQYQRFQRKKDDIGPECWNGLRECFDSFESINEEIGRWSITVEGLKGTVRNWREKRVLLKNLVKEREELIRFRNKLDQSIERHNHLLATLDEANKIMKTAKGKMKAFQMLTSEQERNIKTVLNRWTCSMSTEEIWEMENNRVIEKEIHQIIEMEFDITISICDMITKQKFPLHNKESNQYKECLVAISEGFKNTYRSVDDVRKVAKEIEDLQADADSVQEEVCNAERKKKLHKLSISLNRKLEQLDSTIECMGEKATAELRKMPDFEENASTETSAINWKAIAGGFVAGLTLAMIVGVLIYTGGIPLATIAKIGLVIWKLICKIKQLRNAISPFLKK